MDTYRVFTQYVSRTFSYTPHVFEKQSSRDDIEEYCRYLKKKETVRRIDVTYDDKNHCAVLIVTED